MKTINYKSDFKIVEEFSDGSSLFNSPFTFTYYTKPSTQYVVIYDGENYINCRPLDEGRLLVIFDNHNLSTGVLKVKREFELEDSDFKDNIYNKIIEQDLPIVLEKGTQCYCNDEEEIHIEIPVAYQMGGGVSLEEVNYSELKELKDSNKLIPGSSYRITDYVTTVAGLDLVKSANHPFDIIVTALSTNELSEDAKAILHAGDEYFAKCQLSAWELKYCLDNDTNRFTWADTENGKGVVWYMKDEFDNSAYYDFKGVQVREKNNSNDWYYTFSVYYTDTQEDFSVAKYNYNGKGCVGNTIDIQHLAVNYNKVTINYNTIIADARSADGTVNLDNYYWRSIYNHIGKYCFNIKVTKSCTNVKFGNYCRDITFAVASNVSFGNQNQFIYFNMMDDTVFGPYISNFKFIKKDGTYADVASSRIETNFNGGYYINIKSAHTLKNLHIKAGVADGKTQTIEIDKCGNYTTTIERSASTGEVIVSKSGDIQIQITYSELVALRNNNKLVPGMSYRITDYVTTTTQVDTQSAGHQFDIIVTALTNNTLSEEAKVCLHEGDTYFSNNDLNSLKIKYSLDNDTSRFAWADTENGKGVIYYMKDEFGNEAPYDFKNILFTENGYYTFHTESFGGDMSLRGNMCSNNSIKELIDENGVRQLPGNILVSVNDSDVFNNNIFNSGVRNCTLVTMGIGSSSILTFNIVNYEFLNGLTDKTYLVNLTMSGQAPYWDKKYVSERSNAVPGGAARYGVTSVLNSLITINNSLTNKQDKLKSGTNIKTINGESLLGSEDIQIKTEILVTHSELVTLRNENKLIPGVYYRITDYEFTTKQVNTKSAGHPFDVIVLATAENQLSELARAIQHEGDTYFDDNDLGAWELWYDLDNDTDKYEWADSENGKGIIYRMIDEKRNDCPYDFKNALFYNTNLTSYTTTDNYYYTFSYVVNGVLYDGTVEKQVKNCYDNSMGTHFVNNKKYLNLNVFRNIAFFYNCHSNIFGNNCYYNIFGNNCYYNTFGNRISNRTLDSDNTSITLNDEYFDDGGGQLVPIKHPDLSSQPSILPYKFMGQYVYEQLIPTSLASSSNNSTFSLSILAIDKPIFLDAFAIGKQVCSPSKVNIDSSNIIFSPYSLVLDEIKTIEYYKVIYTLMPEEEDYYGYNN